MSDQLFAGTTSTTTAASNDDKKLDLGRDAVLSGHVHVPFVVEREPGGSELLSISSGTLSTRRRDNNPAFNHIEVTPDEMVITMVEFDAGGFLRSEAFRKRRAELSAWRQDGYTALRKDAKVVATQPLRD